jgi:hypothetical protein
MNEVDAMLDVSLGSAYHIVQDVLHFHEVSTRWVRRQVSPELKERRMEAEGDGFLNRIVTSTSTSLRRRGQAKNAVIPAHQNPKNF